MSIRVYMTPPGMAPYHGYEVWAGNERLDALQAPVSAMPFNRRWPGHQRSADQAEDAAFVRFEGEGEVEMRVLAGQSFHRAVVRPLSRGVRTRVKDGWVCFALPAPGGYTLELDGWHKALHIFYDARADYAVPEGALVFGDGAHDAGEIRLTSGQTLYLSEGAVVYGRVVAEDASDVAILGRGILDGSKNREEILFAASGDGGRDVGNSVRKHAIELKNCRGVTIDGITVRDSLLYNVGAYGCEGLTVANVKLIGSWRYNTDGIDLHNCSHCRVRDCFLRVYDDALCVKGHPNLPPVCEDITFERCVVWCDWGRALEFGAETFAREMKNITFRDIDVIRTAHMAIDLQSVDGADIHDVAFRDIRVEYDAVCPRPAIQSSDADAYAFDPGDTYLPRLLNAEIAEHYEYSCEPGADKRGRTRDIDIVNITVYSESGRMPPSRFSGFDENHKVERVRISGLTLNRRPLTSLEAANVELGPFAGDITVE